MPKVKTNNKFWMRGTPINQKRHSELTEAEKADVVRCRGIKDTHPCKKPVFRCPECGNYGCDQEVVDKCSEQGFKNDKCLHCGVVGTSIPVMAKELEKLIAEWQKEVPAVEK